MDTEQDNFACSVGFSRNLTHVWRDLLLPHPPQRCTSQAADEAHALALVFREVLPVAQDPEARHVGRGVRTVLVPASASGWRRLRALSRRSSNRLHPGDFAASVYLCSTSLTKELA